VWALGLDDVNPIAIQIINFFTVMYHINNLCVRGSGRSLSGVRKGCSIGHRIGPAEREITQADSVQTSPLSIEASPTPIATELGILGRRERARLARVR